MHPPQVEQLLVTRKLPVQVLFALRLDVLFVVVRLGDIVMNDAGPPPLGFDTAVLLDDHRCPPQHLGDLCERWRRGLTIRGSSSRFLLEHGLNEFHVIQGVLDLIYLSLFYLRVLVNVTINPEVTRSFRGLGYSFTYPKAHRFARYHGVSAPRKSLLFNCAQL